VSTLSIADLLNVTSSQRVRTVGVHQPLAKFPQEGSNHPFTLLTTEEGSLKPAWPIHGHVADALSETA
jgi:hypothetical protein